MDDLAIRELASIVADWAEPACDTTVYVFGSRVRGDSRQDSDVDLCVEHGGSNESVQWWVNNNKEDFKSLRPKLPGLLHFPGGLDPSKIKYGQQVHKDRNVVCIWLPRSEGLSK